MPILELRSELKLHTRNENQIENEIDRRPVRAGDAAAIIDTKARYPNCRHRPVGPSRQYNCHGLTFASRRTWICKPSEISKILHDDSYEQIQRPEDVLPGDVVVYTREGDPEHSGIVVSISPEIWVLSKWGALHEVIHRVTECPYNQAYPEFYRITT
jgi:hypothetical protein